MEIVRAPRRWTCALAIATVLPLLMGASSSAPPRPQDPRLTAFAYDEMTRHDYRTAIEHLRSRIKADHRDANAVFLLGVAHARLGEFKVAAHDLDVYRRHGGKNPELSYELGLALLWSRGDLGEATSMLEGYQQAHPGSTKAALAVGEAYLAGQRFDDADRSFRIALTGRAEYEDALFWIATLQRLRGNDAVARQYLDQLLATNPRSPRLLGLERVAAAASQPQGARP